jgi:hypothetical protein
MTENMHARRLFIPAAIFNFLAGGAFLFALPQLAVLMKIQLSPSMLPFVHATVGAVLLLGWGYWQVANDPVRNRIVIVMGIAGKLLFVAIGFGHALAGNIGWAFAALTAVDLVFAVLFWRFLSSHPSVAMRSDFKAS